MTLLLDEGLAEGTCHLVLPQFRRKIDEQFPTVMIRQFCDVDRMKALRDRCSRVCDDLHESDRRHPVHIRALGDGGGVGPKPWSCATACDPM
jgi:hypothetical protein